MHPFHDYLSQHLDDLLRKRSVVVFYDPRSEFIPFFDRELAVGRAGMAVDADLDRVTGTLTLVLGSEASVGMMLTSDTCQSLRVVVLDAHTDRLLAESDELAVRLGI